MKLIFLGPPGAGKGTQATGVSSNLRVPHISTGDMFRNAIKNQTPTGLEAKRYMDAGQLVPDSVVVAMVKERLAMDDCQNGYILDGFPRTVPQAEALDTIAKIDVVVDLDVADEELIARLSGRRVCLACGATYHVSRLNGETKCASCGEELIQRKDDSAETVLNRLNVYHEQTAPLVDYYQKKGNLKVIDGAQDMDTIFESILAVVKG